MALTTNYAALGRHSKKYDHDWAYQTCIKHLGLRGPTNEALVAIICRKTGWPCPTVKQYRRKVIHRFATMIASGRRPSEDFYRSREWRELRFIILNEQGRRCQCCGLTPEKGAILHVDHIFPISTHPHLKLYKKNLQVLCEDCNIGKSNKHINDYRENK